MLINPILSKYETMELQTFLITAYFHISIIYFCIIIRNNQNLISGVHSISPGGYVKLLGKPFLYFFLFEKECWLKGREVPIGCLFIKSKSFIKCFLIRWLNNFGNFYWNLIVCFISLSVFWSLVIWDKLSYFFVNIPLVNTKYIYGICSTAMNKSLLNQDI